MIKHQIIIFDSCVTLTGHNKHYNQSLQKALIDCGHHVTLIECNRTHNLISKYKNLFFFIIKSNYNNIILPTPTFAQYILCFILSFIFQKKYFLLFIRRLEEDLKKRKLKNICYSRIFIRKNIRLLVDNWRIAEELKLQKKSTLLPIPPRGIHTVQNNVECRITRFLSKYEVTFAFLGRLHKEKGMSHYDAIICHLLTNKFHGVFLQLSADQNDLHAQNICESLQSKYQSNDQVYIHVGKLTDEEYDIVISLVDIGVTPYDAASYGLGSSGVAAEFIMSGKVVLSSEIEWLKDNTKIYETSVFFDPNDLETVSEKITEAVKLSKKKNSNRSQTDNNWSLAVAQIMK